MLGSLPLLRLVLCAACAVHGHPRVRHEVRAAAPPPPPAPPPDVDATVACVDDHPLIAPPDPPAPVGADGYVVARTRDFVDGCESRSHLDAFLGEAEPELARCFEAADEPERTIVLRATWTLGDWDDHFHVAAEVRPDPDSDPDRPAVAHPRELAACLAGVLGDYAASSFPLTVDLDLEHSHGHDGVMGGP